VEVGEVEEIHRRPYGRRATGLPLARHAPVGPQEYDMLVFLRRALLTRTQTRGREGLVGATRPLVFVLAPPVFSGWFYVGGGGGGGRIAKDVALTRPVGVQYAAPHHPPAPASHTYSLVSICTFPQISKHFCTSK
jgi:hypothetical protein